MELRLPGKFRKCATSACRLAAQLPAAHSVKAPDALQLATALLAECPVFLTNDRELPPVPGTRILTVQAYLSAL